MSYYDHAARVTFKRPYPGVGWLPPDQLQALRDKYEEIRDKYSSSLGEGVRSTFEGCYIISEIQEQYEKRISSLEEENMDLRRQIAMLQLTVAASNCRYSSATTGPFVPPPYNPPLGGTPPPYCPPLGIRQDV